MKNFDLSVELSFGILFKGKIRDVLKFNELVKGNKALEG